MADLTNPRCERCGNHHNPFASIKVRAFFGCLSADERRATADAVRRALGLESERSPCDRCLSGSCCRRNDEACICPCAPHPHNSDTAAVRSDPLYSDESTPRGAGQ